MSPTPIPLGGRLPLADYNSLTAQQQRFFDEMTSTVVPWAGASAFLAQDGEGRFIGPFNPALLHPDLGKSFLELQYVEANHSVLTARTREVIILTVGSVWQADYELYAHSAVAGHAELPEDVVISLVAGETPDGLPPEELIAHRVARQLTVERRIDDSLYRMAEDSFGRQGVLDIVILVGIYQTVCGLLNAFEIPAPSPVRGQSSKALSLVADNTHV